MVTTLALAVPALRAQPRLPARTAPSSSVASPTASEVDDAGAEARRRYAAGQQAFAAKRYIEAALHFEAAAAYRPHAVALYTAALAWDLSNRPDRAADDYVRAVEVPGLTPTQVKNAKTRVDALEKALGTLVVNGPSSLHVQLDDNPDVPLPARLHATSGIKQLTIWASWNPVERRDVRLAVGQVTEVDLSPAPAVASAPATPPPAPPPAPPVRTRRSIARDRAGAALVSGGGVALLSGILLRVLASSSQGTDASRLRQWSSASLVAGGAAATGGIVLLAWPSATAQESPRVGVSVSPTGVDVQGTFLSLSSSARPMGRGPRRSAAARGRGYRRSEAGRRSASDRPPYAPEPTRASRASP